MKEFNKLVRDKIPQIISDRGQTPVIRILDDAEYMSCLGRKLDEEVAEFHESGALEELADILEVVYALCQAKGFSVAQLQSAYQKKHSERGGFEKKIFLIRKE